MTREETINRAVAWATGIAQDSAHGYDQAHRWGPDYDCSSFVIEAWEKAGVFVKTNGASYTGDMYFAFLRCGFEDVTNAVNIYTGGGMQKGDVLLNKASHTELYIGDGKCVKASINERGGVTGGQPGDQTGREIYIGRYYNYPWDCVLRYKPKENSESSPVDAEKVELLEKKDPIFLPCHVKLPELQRGDKGETVKALQILLNGRGCSCGMYGADGDFGPATEAALLAFQRRNDLEADGICGNESWAALLGVKA